MSVDGVVGGDICELSLQPDYINITCSLRFSGANIVAPTLMWHHNNTAIKSLNVTNTIVPNARVTSAVIVHANEEMNGSRIACSVRMFWNEYNTSVPSTVYAQWTSDYLNILCK